MIPLCLGQKAVTIPSIEFIAQEQAEWTRNELKAERNMSEFVQYKRSLSLSRTMIKKAAKEGLTGHLFQVTTGRYGCLLNGRFIGRHIRNLFERRCILCDTSELFVGKSNMYLHHITRDGDLHGDAQPWWVTLVCRECHDMIHQEEQYGFFDMMCLLKAFEYAYEDERLLKRGLPDISLVEALEPDIIFEMYF